MVRCKQLPLKLILNIHIKEHFSTSVNLTQGNRLYFQLFYMKKYVFLVKYIYEKRRMYSGKHN